MFVFMLNYTEATQNKGLAQKKRRHSRYSDSNPKNLRS